MRWPGREPPHVVSEKDAAQAGEGAQQKGVAGDSSDDVREIHFDYAIANTHRVPQRFSIAPAKESLVREEQRGQILREPVKFFENPFRGPEKAHHDSLPSKQPKRTTKLR